MSDPFTWEKASYGLGEVCRLGPFCVGSVTWSVITKEDRDKPYKAHLELPGINLKADRRRHADIQSAKSQVERGARAWIRRAGLTFKEGSE